MDFFYKKATSSSAFGLWAMDEETTVPSKEEFFEKWKDYYFQDEQNHLGRCFHIAHQSEWIGEVDYHKIIDNKVQVNILIYNKAHWNKGYGTSALKLISAYLEEKYHVSDIWVKVPSSNNGAVQAYKKAGFNLESSQQEDNLKLVKK